MKKLRLFGFAAATTLIAASCASTAPAPGQLILFDDQTYHFEALRTLGYTATGGADINEILVALGDVEPGDIEGWYAAWRGLAERSEELAGTYPNDPRGESGALMRASNYYRTADFLLDGDDERKLRGLYFPAQGGKSARTLVVMINGFDSTMEEAYMNLGVETLARGFSFASYEGPGQGGAIRLDGIPMTHEWEPVNRAALDTFLTMHPEVERVVLIGWSLGSVFATKAAANDDRIDYLVHYDVFYNFALATSEDQPESFREGIFHPEGPTDRGRRMLGYGMRFSNEVDWAMRHGAWVMGLGDDYAESYNRYRLYEISEDAPKVTIPVLLQYGALDHFMPESVATASEEAFSNSPDVTLVRYGQESGGAEHCRVGAVNLFTADLFEWLAVREGQGEAGAR